MPRRLIPLVLLLLTANACTGLKPLTPLDPSRRAAVLESCRSPFLQDSHRLVHSLERVMPDGAKGTAIGILVADPRTRHFRTVMMTIEGWVLFDAEARETLTLHRAVPPFDAPAFAKALAEDIFLAFFPPGDVPAAWGEDEEGAQVCRFELADRRFVEVIMLPDRLVEIRLYGTGQEIQKRVNLTCPRQPGLADELEIRNSWPPYTLRLRLLESEALEGNPGPRPAANGSGGSAGAVSAEGKGAGAP